MISSYHTGQYDSKWWNPCMTPRSSDTEDSLKAKEGDLKPSEPQYDLWACKAFVYGYNSSCATEFKGISSIGFWLYSWMVLFYKVRFIHQKHSYANYLVVINLMAAFTTKSTLILLIRPPKSFFDIGKVCLRPVSPLSQIFQNDE